MLIPNFKEYEDARNKLIKNKLYKGIVAFGSARIPMDDPHIKEIHEIAVKCAERVLAKKKKISFITGGGPSVMTAWLEGSYNTGAQAAGMALVLPHEKPEDQLKFCDKDVSYVFETFQARKALMFEFAKCIIIFKGGFGTMDELFEALTFMKTHKIPDIPVFIYPADFYENILNFDSFLEAKTIKPEEIECLHYINSKEELLKKLFELIDNDND